MLLNTRPKQNKNLQVLNTNPCSPWRVTYRRLSHFVGQRLALTQASLWTPMSAGLSWSATVIRIMSFICCCTCHQSASLSSWDPANHFCPLLGTFLNFLKNFYGTYIPNVWCVIKMTSGDFKRNQMFEALAMTYSFPWLKITIQNIL